MHIGLDFDNTIICYDQLFWHVARERGLIPADLPQSKEAVRDYLRATGREPDWTEMQGEVYGARIDEARAFPGVIEFIAALRDAGHTVSIISHKTERPFRGPGHDLHAAARRWLVANGVVDSAPGALVPTDRVYFETTKEAKLERIGLCGCDVYVDDLPEILLEPAFPSQTQRILIDYRAVRRDLPGTLIQCASWRAVADALCAAVDRHCIREMSAAEKLAAEDALLLPVAGGRNNRSFLLRDERSSTFVKRYVLEPGGRDRGSAEWLFSRYARLCGAAVPEPLAQHRRPDGSEAIAFQFTAGTPGRSITINERMVAEAIQFIVRLQHHLESEDARALPAASESCRSIEQHLFLVQSRVDRVLREAELPENLREIFAQQLVPRWNEIVTFVREMIRNDAALDAPLTDPELVVSPSDFGFHNAIVGNAGRGVTFVDFEHAGWDDPGKLVADFLCQPEVPVPEEYGEVLIAELAGARGFSEPWLATRVSLLLPCYVVKWCCIMLNHYVPSSAARRRYADPRGRELGDHQRVERLLRSYLARISL
ncbi:MAG: hypothetical protein FJ392_05090 [Verrucomicrobia bacterium]|nr:hypothetical protein [Verrucomicrobiota bacterium]